jgi:putative ABC transport system permease protein
MSNYFINLWETITQLNILVRIALSAVLLIVILALSFWQNINMEKMFIWSFFRGFIQIILLGSILELVFELDKIWLLIIVLLIMCLFAAFTTSRKYPYPKIFPIMLVAITSSSLLIMTFVMLSGLFIPVFEGIIPYPPVGEYVIPMGSMVISNTMGISGIIIERTKSDILKSKGRIEAALALGDSPSNAIKTVMFDSYRSGLIPIINRVSLLGIVVIPGLMSGMIIGGVHPIEAAVFQIVIYLMIISSAFLSSIIATTLFTKAFFTSEQQFDLTFLNNLREIEKKTREQNKNH